MIRCAAACLAVCLIAGTVHAEARRVLLLYSYERELTHYTFAGLFRPELMRSSPDPIDFIEMSLQPVRTSHVDPDKSALDALRGVAAGRHLDLVVPIGGPAASFARKYAERIFPGTPVLLAVDSRFVEGQPLAAHETAVLMHNDPVRMLESILRLLPDTKTVVVITGASRLEEFWLAEVKRAFKRYSDRVDFVWTNEWSLEELLRQCSRLPARSAIFYGIFSVDAAGVPHLENDTLAALHTAANAPLFGLHTTQLGRGIVGGPLLSLEDFSRDAAATALRLLRGELPPSIPPVTVGPGLPVFDARELQRWHIAEGRLEPGSEVRFREPTTWQEHKGLIVVAVSAAGAQALLVVALVTNLSRRRRAAAAGPVDLRGAEAALARLSHRLMQASEHERASTAKAINDDVCQQMAVLTLRLHALGVETEGRAGNLRLRIEELCGQFWNLEREILAISDPLYHRLTLLGLAASAEAFCERRCAEAGLALDFRAGGVPDKLPESVAIAMFRVLEEAVGNAITHSRSPRIAVSLAGTADAIELDVVDEGTGFDVDSALARGALGLIGVSERMRLVGGTCTIESRRGAGTRVRARAPLARAAR